MIESRAEVATWQVGRAGRWLLALAVLITGVAYMPVAAPAGAAGTASWDTSSDFLMNASTTGETVTVSRLTTSRVPGSLSMPEWERLAAGFYHTVGLRPDGTVLAAGLNSYGQCLVTGWTDIVDVDAGGNHTVGLRSDGIVVATGSTARGQCNVSAWRDIVAIACGENFTLGLKADGTVVATGDNGFGQLNVAGWTGVVSIAAGDYHTIGLKADGTAVAAGRSDLGQCNVSGWAGLVAVDAPGIAHTVGLKADGTVYATGLNNYGQCNVAGWSDIIAVSGGGWHTLGLKADGTAVAAGHNGYSQGVLGGWSDIVAIAGGRYFTVGLKADGTPVSAGANDQGQRNLAPWGAFAEKPVVGTLGGPAGSVGLRADGGADLAAWTGLSGDIAALRLGQAVKIAVRVSQDGVAWSEPLGRDGAPVDWSSGEGSYFGRAYGDTAWLGDFSAIPRARFLDLVVRLESGGMTWPVLRSLSLTYDLNSRPVAGADSYALDQETVLAVGAAAGVLANDADADGDAMTAWLVGGPAHGTLLLAADGSFTYTPQAGFSGTDSFTYDAFDGIDHSLPAMVSLTVDPVQAPAPVELAPTPEVSRPIAPSAMIAGKPVKVTGTLKPRHKAGTAPVRVYLYRKVGGAWKSYGYVPATVANHGAYSKYSAAVKLPSAGQWRLQAVHPEDADHAEGVSAYRVVKVHQPGGKVPASAKNYKSTPYRWAETAPLIK